MSASENRQIAVPQMCQRHAAQLVHRLGIPENGPWRVAIVISNILLLQAAAASKTVRERTAGDPSSLSLVLAEIGCLACFDPNRFHRVLKIAKAEGLSFAAKLSRRDVTHVDWDIWDGVP